MTQPNKIENIRFFFKPFLQYDTLLFTINYGHAIFPPLPLLLSFAHLILTKLFSFVFTLFPLQHFFLLTLYLKAELTIVSCIQWQRPMEKNIELLKTAFESTLLRIIYDRWLARKKSGVNEKEWK